MSSAFSRTVFVVICLLSKIHADIQPSKRFSRTDAVHSDPFCYHRKLCAGISFCVAHQLSFRTDRKRHWQGQHDVALRTSTTWQDQESFCADKDCDSSWGIMEKRLAACVNIFPRTATMYYWKGEIRDASEILLLVRTRTSLIQRLKAYLRAVHPYDIPEIISFPIDDGSLHYLKWMEDALTDI